VKRGDIVLVTAHGDYGKPRPALVVQSDEFSDLPSVVVALMTSAQRPLSPLIRKAIAPSLMNGLRLPTDVMVDKLMTFPMEKVRGPIGHLSSTEMVEISSAMALILGL